MGFSLVKELERKRLPRAGKVVTYTDPALKGSSKPPADYFRYLRSPEWKAKKEQCFKAKGRKCAVCGSLWNIEVHHMTYARLGDEKMSDLLVVCDKHHEEIHAYHNKTKGVSLRIASLHFIKK